MFAAAVLRPSSFSLEAFSMLQHAMASLGHPGKASVGIAHVGLAKPLTRDAKRRAQFTVASRPKTVVEFSPFCVCQEAVDGDAKVIISR